MADFDSSGDQRFVMDAAAFAASPPAGPRLIDLDMFRTAANPVLIWPHHASPKLVQNAEGGFISRQPKLPLKLHCRHTRRLAGDKVGGPEPDAERRVAALHDGAD